MRPKEELTTKPCRGCGKPIVWGIAENGARIPLDPRAPVYRFGRAGEDITADRDHGAMVSHFATCPEASRFSGSSRKAPDGSIPEPFGVPESELGSKRGQGLPPRMRSSANPGRVGASKQGDPTRDRGEVKIGPVMGPFDLDGVDG